ncbi:hypothetical protein [Neolewinella maritima]
MLDEYWDLLPLVLLFGNPFVLRYVTELKPYGLDLGLAALLIALHLRGARHRTVGLGSWAAIGSLVPWFSLPSVFVLATVGLRELRYDRRWLLVITGWLASFALLYVLVLRPSIGSNYLNDFHQDYFLPLRPDTASLAQVGRIVSRLLRLCFGLTLVAQVWGALLLLAGGLLAPRKLWLLLPLGIVVAVSGMQLYSLIDRLILFVLPGVWVVAALGAQNLAAYVRRSRPAYAVVIVLTLLLAGGGNIYYRYWQPEHTSDGRELATYAEGPHTYIDESAVPVVDYYTRIHPATRYTTAAARARTPHTGQSNYTLLFDVMTEQTIRVRAENAAEAAAARGCEVKEVDLFRARVVELRCPVRNSDP